MRLFCLLFLTTTLFAQVADERLLFILHADHARVTLGRGATVSGTLVLYDVNDSVAFFSEQPDRHAGTIPLSDFLKNWEKEGFTLSPPNAGFVFYSPSRSPASRTARYSEVNFVLQNPRYSSKRDSLTFDINLIDVGTDLPSGNLLEPTLFIDAKARKHDAYTTQ